MGEKQKKPLSFRKGNSAVLRMQTYGLGMLKYCFSDAKVLVYAP